MTLKRNVIVIAALLLVGAAITLALILSGVSTHEDRKTDGPLMVPPGHGYSGVIVQPTQQFADGLETLRVDGREVSRSTMSPSWATLRSSSWERRCCLRRGGEEGASPS